jgi:hypothetical protein
LRRKGQSLPKIVVTIGGFLVMIGIILLGIAALSLSGLLNVDLLLKNKHVLTFAVLMVAVGLLDTFSAIIIARW